MKKNNEIKEILCFESPEDNKSEIFPKNDHQKSNVNIKFKINLNALFKRFQGKKTEKDENLEKYDNLEKSQNLENYENLENNTLKNENVSFLNWIEYYSTWRFAKWVLDYLFSEPENKKNESVFEKKNQDLKIDSFWLGVELQKIDNNSVILSDESGLNSFDLGCLTKKLDSKNISIPSMIQYGNFGQLRASTVTNRTNLRQSAQARQGLFIPGVVGQRLSTRIPLAQIAPSRLLHLITTYNGNYIRAVRLTPKIVVPYVGITENALGARIAQETIQLRHDARYGPVFRFHNRIYATTVHNLGSEYALRPGMNELVTVVEIYENADLAFLTPMETSQIHELVLTGKIHNKTLREFFIDNVPYFGEPGSGEPGGLVLSDDDIIIPANLKQLPFNSTLRAPNGLSIPLIREILHVSENDPGRLDELTQKRVIKIFAPLMPDYNGDRNLAYILSRETDLWVDDCLGNYSQQLLTRHGIPDYRQMFRNFGS